MRYEFGEGVLTFTILPVYAGAVNRLGEEPLSNRDYQRGMIRWDVRPDGERVGRSNIYVPQGIWQWVIYCYHPTLPIFYAVEKLRNPVSLLGSGMVSLDYITMENIKPNAHPLGVLPD